MKFLYIKLFCVILLLTLTGCQVKNQDVPSTQPEQLIPKVNAEPDEVSSLPSENKVLSENDEKIIENEKNDSTHKENNTLQETLPPNAMTPESDILDQTQETSPPNAVTPESDVLDQTQETLPNSYVEITYSADYSNNTQTKIITDDIRVKEINAFFENLTESDVSMTPQSGGRLFIINIVDDESITSYRFGGEKYSDGNYYCQSNVNYTISSSGWLKISDPLVYDYLTSIFEG